MKTGPGAEDGARTRDLNLGKVALYQLSYFRRDGECSPAGWSGKPTPADDGSVNGQTIRIHPLRVTSPAAPPPRPGSE